MNAPSSRSTSPIPAGSVTSRMVLLVAVLLATVAAVASYLTLEEPNTFEAPRAGGAAATAPTAGTPLPHDHSVTRNLPHDPETPGVSIAAYAVP